MEIKSYSIPFHLKLTKNKHISATVLQHHVVLMLNCRGVILQRDKYRDSQSQTFTFYACLILCSYQLNVDLIFMQCSHREKPHLRRRAAASIGAKPYMVLAWSGLYLTNSYLCINTKSTHTCIWLCTIKVMSFENILTICKHNNRLVNITISFIPIVIIT